jgi:hypothetical protein
MRGMVQPLDVTSVSYEASDHTAVIPLTSACHIRIDNPMHKSNASTGVLHEQP